MTRKIVRAANAARIWYSFIISTATRNPLVVGLPLAISAELTNNCNLSCPECVTGSEMMSRERGFMDFELYKRVITELRPYLYSINLYFQGEPMLHPEFFNYPSFTDDINTVVSTNGHYLSVENSEKLARSGLKKLIVSLDGMDQDTYSKYRKNGNFSKVVEGIKNIGQAINRNRSPLKLELQLLVNRFNEHQLKQTQLFAAEAGATLKLKSMQVIDSQDSGKWMPSERKFIRYKEAGGVFLIRNSLPDRCLRLWLNPVITWDGKVVPCCFDKDADFVMGDLNKDTFRSIWHGARYREFRKSVLTGRNQIRICRNCTSGMISEIIR